MRLRKPPLRLRAKTVSREVLTFVSFPPAPTCTRLALFAIPLLIFAFGTTVARAQYTSIVVFGDSLSDTGNDAILTGSQYPYVPVPSPLGGDYTYGRFTDGADTLPAANNYFGVWIEQLQAMLPGVPVLKPSLAGGNNYAYGFATTGGGTGVFTYGPSDEFSVNVDNVGLQISNYLATHPKITGKTLFVVWAGAINVLYANSTADVLEGALEETADIQRLIDAGATNILVPNLPPLGDTPRLNGSPTTASQANEASAAYNDTLQAGLDVLPIINFFRGVHIYEIDTYALFSDILASYPSLGLINVTSPSQDEPVDPDLYLFWDDLHPTTRGHNLFALEALKIIAPAQCAAESKHGGTPTCEEMPLAGGEVF